MRNEDTARVATCPSRCSSAPKASPALWSLDDHNVLNDDIMLYRRRLETRD